jgi:4-hydroxythreonine-4-phosphate dehydrogenase
VSDVAPAEALRIGVTLGDPRGIGPEVAAAATRRLRGAAAHHLVFIGPVGTVADDAGDSFEATGSWRPGGDAALAGRLAGDAIDRGIRMALSGAIDALVTAPIDKAALHAGGFNFPGHTEMLASRVGIADVVMLMAAERTALGGPLRVVLATTHIALRDVPGSLTVERLVSQVRITHAAMRDSWGITTPRIALCAFNPHASDGGLFGDEEERLYAPAMELLREAGTAVAGPISADTVFVRAIRGEFDVVVAPYHDVGMAAFKTASFGSGVNVTLGLPFPRTSPDHGTALDLAGRNTADATSMHEALMLAARLAQVQRMKQQTAP